MGVLSAGQIVLAVVPGDYGGRPRPAVLVQRAGLEKPGGSVLICPITSTLCEADPMRLEIKPTAANGLDKPCQIMVDKLFAIRRERIKRSIGVLPIAQQEKLAKAIKGMF